MLIYWSSLPGKILFLIYCTPYWSFTFYSSSENYLVTCTYEHVTVPNEALIVWSVRNQTKLRTFELKNPFEVKAHVQFTVTEEIKKGDSIKISERVARGRVISVDKKGSIFTIVEGSVTHERVSSDKVAALQNFNVLKWSGDGRYVARQAADAIAVYELPHMGLLEKKSVAALGAIDFAWSPRGSVLSYWSPASGNLPAQVNILSLPDRKVISTRRIFDVLDGHMVWQNEGDYLCVCMTKQQGKKPKTYTLILFRMKEPGVPVENLELTEPVSHLSFEPSGDRLVIVQGDAKNPTLTFYNLTGLRGIKELTLLSVIKDVQCSEVLWSPAGNVAALTYFQSDNCFFSLYDTESCAMLATRRHERCSRLVWDPSGRTLATFYLTSLRQAHARGQEDNCMIWSFQGAHICTVKKEKLYRFLWRPRPANVMTPEEKQKVIKNMKKYEKIFDKEDHRKKNELKAEIEAKKRDIAASFLSLLAQRREENQRKREKHVALKDGYDSDDDANYTIVVQVEETVLSNKEVIMQ